MVFEKAIIYKVGLIGSLFCQLSILCVVPYFLFFGLEPTQNAFKSGYFASDDIWMYFLFLCIFCFLGIIINCTNFFINSKKWNMIKMFLLIMSSVPMPLILPFVLGQFFDIKHDDMDVKIGFGSDNKVQNQKEVLYRKIGLYGILCCNIIALLQIFMMFNVEIFFTKGLKVDNSRMATVYLISYIVFAMLSLFSVIMTIIFKKNWLVLITAIVSLPLIIGTVIFAAILFLSLKSYFNNLYQTKRVNLNKKLNNLN